MNLEWSIKVNDALSVQKLHQLHKTATFSKTPKMAFNHNFQFHLKTVRKVWNNIMREYDGKGNLLKNKLKKILVKNSTLTVLGKINKIFKMTARLRLRKLNLY